KDAGHCEAGHDDSEDDDQTCVEEKLRDETAWSDLVNVASNIAFEETWRSGFEGIAVVKQAGSIFTRTRVLSEKDGADGGINGVVGDGFGVGGHVGREIEDDAIDDHEILERGDLLPIVTHEMVSANDTEAPESGIVSGTEGTCVVSRTRGISSE